MRPPSRNRRRLVRPLLTALLLTSGTAALPGCATALNCGDWPEPSFYVGTSIYAQMIPELPSMNLWHGHPPGLIAWMLVLIDFPLSLAADTALVPVNTAFWAFGSGPDDEDPKTDESDDPDLRDEPDGPRSQDDPVSLTP
jgi:hypothetical protein